MRHRSLPSRKLKAGHDLLQSHDNTDSSSTCSLTTIDEADDKEEQAAAFGQHSYDDAAASHSDLHIDISAAQTSASSQHHDTFGHDSEPFSLPPKGEIGMREDGTIDGGDDFA